MTSNHCWSGSRIGITGARGSPDKRWQAVSKAGAVVTGFTHGKPPPSGQVSWTCGQEDNLAPHLNWTCWC